MSVQKIAADFTAMLRAGQFIEAGAKYWTDDVVSIEAGSPPGGPDPKVVGRAAVTGKGEWWSANHEVHGSTIEGPLVNGDQFVLRIKMEVTPKASGQRITMDEIALYTVRGDKIAEEKFFYAMG